MKANYAWNIVAKTGDNVAPIKMVSKKIINCKVTLTGRVRNDHFEELNLAVDNLE